MQIINSSKITDAFLKSNGKHMPLIFMAISARIQKKLILAGYREITINLPLSGALLAYPPEDRPMHAETELSKIVADGPLLISNFEMLFDPRYEIDILKFFCEKARFHPIAIIWPGKYENNKLTYAGRKDKDYHEYNCDSYQIGIVQ